MAVPFPNPKVCKSQTSGKPCKLFVTSTLSGLWQEDIPSGSTSIVLLSLSSDRQETWGYGQPEWLISLVCESKRPAFPHPCIHSVRVRLSLVPWASPSCQHRTSSKSPLHEAWLQGLWCFVQEAEAECGCCKFCLWPGEHTEFWKGINKPQGYFSRAIFFHRLCHLQNEHFNLIWQINWSQIQKEKGRYLV